jgi:signal peptidase II
MDLGNVSIVLLLAAVIPLADEAIKRWLRRVESPTALAVGALGVVRTQPGRLWLTQAAGVVPVPVRWAIWSVAAAPLVWLAASAAGSPILIGLLLGGSLSNALESTWRGAVSDYICLRFWPAFNLADVALTIGAIGLPLHLLISIAGAR